MNAIFKCKCSEVLGFVKTSRSKREKFIMIFTEFPPKHKSKLIRFICLPHSIFEQNKEKNALFSFIALSLWMAVWSIYFVRILFALIRYINIYKREISGLMLTICLFAVRMCTRQTFELLITSFIQSNWLQNPTFLLAFHLALVHSTQLRVWMDTLVIDTLRSDWFVIFFGIFEWI